MPGSELQFITPGLLCRICSALLSPQPWFQGGSSYSKGPRSVAHHGKNDFELPGKVCPHQPQHLGRMLFLCGTFLKERGLWDRVRVGLNWPERKCIGTAGPYTPLPQNRLHWWGPCKAAGVTWGSRSEAEAQFGRPSLIILHNLVGGTIPCLMESLQLHFGEPKQIAKFGSTKYVNGCRGADDSLFLGWVPLTLSLFLAFEIVFSLQKVCLQNTFSII